MKIRSLYGEIFGRPTAEQTRQKDGRGSARDFVPAINDTVRSFGRGEDRGFTAGNPRCVFCRRLAVINAERFRSWISVSYRGCYPLRHAAPVVTAIILR